MYTLKGFATHAALANNTPGVTAPYGEISTQAMTYSREKGLYKASTSTDVSIISFLSTDGTAHVAVPQNLVNDIVTIINFIYNKAITTSGELFSDEIANLLLATFPTLGNTFVCGPMVQNNNHYAPEWVSWKSTGVAGLDTSNMIKIWLSDAAFKLQYDEFSIVVIPPLAILDDFFRTGAQVETTVNAVTQVEMISRVQLAKGNNPETVIRAESFDYVDPLNASHKVPTTWHVLIYGAAGNNIDSISDALVDYILSHTTHTRNEWVNILPDLFKRTEFIIVPFWNIYAIPNRQIEAGIHSPCVTPAVALDTVRNTVPGYAPSHINAHMQIVSNPYKSLQMGVIGGADNRSQWFKLTDVFPDYINVSSTSHDFGRMLQATQDWMTMLANMIFVAESITDFSGIPADMTKAKRNGKLFVVKRFGNINYLVAAKVSVPT